MFICDQCGHRLPKPSAIRWIWGTNPDGEPGGMYMCCSGTCAAILRGRTRPAWKRLMIPAGVSSPLLVSTAMSRGYTGREQNHSYATRETHQAITLDDLVPDYTSPLARAIPVIRRGHMTEWNVDQTPYAVHGRSERIKAARSRATGWFYEPSERDMEYAAVPAAEEAEVYA